MAREKFYEVPRKAWLYQPEAVPAPASELLEEPIRQWCAYELMRAYGYRVIDLSFEHEAKVGSKIYRVDILIIRDGRPFAVVECKQPKHKQHDKALQQAESYANAREIGCDLVLYTNGDTWLVHRRVGEVWYPITDLPRREEAHGDGSIDTLLLTLEAVAPILHKLDEPLEGREAKLFLCALQEFFSGWNLVNRHFSESLRYATDNLLRVLSVGMEEDHYFYEKISAAARQYQAFRRASEIEHSISDSFSGVSKDMCFAELGGGLVAMLANTRESDGPDVLLLSLNVALLKYGRTFAISRKGHPALTPELHHTLRKVLELGFACGLSVKLPTALEATTVSDMKHLCYSAWDGYAKKLSQ